MCQIVIINNKECGSPRELLEALPKLELINSDPEIYDCIELDSCLCQLDLDGTFSKAGIKWSEDDFCGYIINNE